MSDKHGKKPSKEAPTQEKPQTAPSTTKKPTSKGKHAKNGQQKKRSESTNKEKKVRSVQQELRLIDVSDPLGYMARTTKSYAHPFIKHAKKGIKTLSQLFLREVVRVMFNSIFPMSSEPLNTRLVKYESSGGDMAKVKAIQNLLFQMMDHSSYNTPGYDTTKPISLQTIVYLYTSPNTTFLAKSYGMDVVTLNDWGDYSTMFGEYSLKSGHWHMNSLRNAAKPSQSGGGRCPAIIALDPIDNVTPTNFIDLMQCEQHKFFDWDAPTSEVHTLHFVPVGVPDTNWFASTVNNVFCGLKTWSVPTTGVFEIVNPYFMWHYNVEMEFRLSQG